MWKTNELGDRNLNISVQQMSVILQMIIYVLIQEVKPHISMVIYQEQSA